MDKSLSTINVDADAIGIQMVNPKHRYKQPLSKLNESDTGGLSIALEND